MRGLLYLLVSQSNYWQLTEIRLVDDYDSAKLLDNIHKCDNKYEIAIDGSNVPIY